MQNMRVDIAKTLAILWKRGRERGKTNILYAGIVPIKLFLNGRIDM